MQVCSALIVAPGGTDNVRIRKNGAGNQKRAGRAATDAGACQSDYWTLIKEQKLIKVQGLQDSSEPVAINRLIELFSLSKKKNVTRFKCLSASPVKLIAGKNNRQLTLCTVKHLHSHHQERERKEKKNTRSKSSLGNASHLLSCLIKGNMHK